MKYTDAHCHIFTAPADNAIIGQICNTTTTTDWEKIVQITNRTHVCIGIHPWHVDSAPANWAEQMQKILSSNPHVMIGEIGLDKNHPNIDTQIEFFTNQIEIATTFNRPIHLHCVGAWDKILHILKAHTPRAPIILHAFNGNAEIMERLCEYNTYFSYKNQNNHINNTAKIAPPNKILVESDCDTPSKQPEILINTTREIAKLRQCNEIELNEQINKNFSGVINYA